MFLVSKYRWFCISSIRRVLSPGEYSRSFSKKNRSILTPLDYPAALWLYWERKQHGERLFAAQTAHKNSAAAVSGLLEAVYPALP